MATEILESLHAQAPDRVEEIDAAIVHSVDGAWATGVAPTNRAKRIMLFRADSAWRFLCHPVDFASRFSKCEVDLALRSRSILVDLALRFSARLLGVGSRLYPLG